MNHESWAQSEGAQNAMKMKGQKNRSLPLTAALARFIDVADLIKSRIARDDVLRDLCDDYHLARKTLTNLKKERPRRSARIAEYTVLAAEIEDEIVRHLLGSGEQEGT
jgi:hypothetical protein